MYVGPHYSTVNDPEAFKANMNRLAEALPLIRAQMGVDTWVVTGKSGIVAMAAMALLAPDEPFLSVRKPGEDTNGATFEGDDGACAAMRQEKLRYGIVDDFVSGGRTMKRVAGQLISARVPRGYADDLESPETILAVVVSYHSYNREAQPENHWGLGRHHAIEGIPYWRV